MSNTNHDSGGQIFAAFITGAAVGMVTALLVAPKSGDEAREDIKDTLNRIKETISNKVEDTKSSTKSKINEAIETTKVAAKESKRAAEVAKERVKNKQKVNKDYNGEEK